MTKTEFLKEVAAKAGTTIKGAEDFYNAFVNVITATVKKNNKVQLTGFASFELKARAARQAINPKTGAKIKVAARKVPVVKLAKAYKDNF